MVRLVYRLLKDRNIPRKAKLVIPNIAQRTRILGTNYTGILDSRIQAANIKVVRLVK